MSNLSEHAAIMAMLDDRRFALQIVLERATNRNLNVNIDTLLEQAEDIVAYLRKDGEHNVGLGQRANPMADDGSLDLDAMPDEVEGVIRHDSGVESFGGGRRKGKA